MVIVVERAAKNMLLKEPVLCLYLLCEDIPIDVKSGTQHSSQLRVVQAHIKPWSPCD